VFLLSDWRKVCATSAAVAGGPPGLVPQERGTGRGRPPPATAELEVTRPRDSERKKRHKECLFIYIDCLYSSGELDVWKTLCAEVVMRSMEGNTQADVDNNGSYLFQSWLTTAYGLVGP
jgi:hypothetical protein